MPSVRVPGPPFPSQPRAGVSCAGRDVACADRCGTRTRCLRLPYQPGDLNVDGQTASSRPGTAHGVPLPRLPLSAWRVRPASGSPAAGPQNRLVPHPPRPPQPPQIPGTLPSARRLTSSHSSGRTGWPVPVPRLMWCPEAVPCGCRVSPWETRLLCGGPAVAATACGFRRRKDLVETGYKPASIALKLAVVRRLYEAIQWRGLRDDNPAAGLKAPRDRTTALQDTRRR
jgi:hypothetical protein